MQVLRWAMLVGVLALSGCVHSEVRRYGTVDTANKTITVPPGGGWLIGALKDALVAEGWTMSVNRGPVVTEGRVGESTRLETSRTFVTRYRLHLADRQVDRCVLGGGVYAYELSIVDNQSGQEIVTLGGRDCEGFIVDKFRAALRGG